MKKAIATQEVLGIYLSCLQETLAYNLPTLIPVGKRGEAEARKALEAILAAHPHLNARLSMEDGVLYQEEV